MKLLWTLICKADEVVPRSVLFDTVWPGVVVSEDALDYQIHCLRRVLGDEAGTPEYIATMHGVGFRFVAEIQTAGVRGDAVDWAGLGAPRHLVGRACELKRLGKSLSQAERGNRQVVFLTGEAGIGKSALAAAFQQAIAQRAEENPTVRVAAGQCLREFGTGEPFLPILQALGRLCRGPNGGQVLDVLRRWAPSTVVRFRALLTAEEHAALSKATAGTTRACEEREIVEAIEVLTEDRPLVLLLDDLHWSDAATMAVVSMLAQRRQPAALLLLCSYRPGDVLASRHPALAVKRELVGRYQAIELALPCLRADAVQIYLEQRFEGSPVPGMDYSRLADFVHARCDGHPLFMQHIADYLAARAGWKEAAAVWDRVPPDLQDFIEQQLALFSEADQAIIEAAGIVGVEFSATDVAAILRTELGTVTDCCERLARHGRFIEACALAAWPDGTLSPRFRFRHALHRDAVTSQVPAARRAQFSRRLAERREKDC